MDLAATVTSVLAFVLSVFTFYWTSIRKKKALYLLRIERLSSNMTPEFALANGGDADVLITRMHCSFQHATKNGWSYPAQRIAFAENDSFLLSKGTAFRCKVEFTEAFTTTFARQGEKKQFGDESFYMFPMRVEVEWADMSGNLHAREVILYQYGFDDNGRIRTRRPEQKRFDLHRSR